MTQIAPSPSSVTSIFSFRNSYPNAKYIPLFLLFPSSFSGKSSPLRFNTSLEEDMAKERLTFRNLLKYFPLVDLPVQLTDDTHFVFSKENKILPEDFVYTFLVKEAEEEADPYTEYLPCLRIEGLGDFIALVVWKASVMNYSYILFTFDGKGQIITEQVIAGTKSNGDTLLLRQATISDSGSIDIIEGIGDSDGKYDPTQSRTYQYELLASGDILQMVDPLDN